MPRTINASSCQGAYNSTDYGYCRDYVDRSVNRWESAYRSLDCDYEFNTYLAGSTIAFQLTAVCEGRGASSNAANKPEAFLETAPELAKLQAEQQDK